MSIYIFFAVITFLVLCLGVYHSFDKIKDKPPLLIVFVVAFMAAIWPVQWAYTLYVAITRDKS